jgi:hypothetical protein
MPRRSVCGGRIPWNGWASIPWNNRVRIALPRIGPARIYGARIDRRISISRTLLPVPLRTTRRLLGETALVLRPARLWPCGLRLARGRTRPWRRRGTGWRCSITLAASPGRGKTHNRNCGSQRYRAHSSRIENPGHNSLPAHGRRLGTANRRSGCWKASLTGPAVGRCCPAFADRGPRRPVPAEMAADPSL